MSSDLKIFAAVLVAGAAMAMSACGEDKTANKAGDKPAATQPQSKPPRTLARPSRPKLKRLK